jgi:S1-C subfamily serine protease
MNKILNKTKPALRFLKRGLVLGAILVTGAYLVLNAGQMHHDYIINKVGPSVVMITNLSANHGGTGFAIQAPSGKEYILTNAHICVGVERPMIITFKDNRQVPLQIIEVSSKTDLCLLSAVGNLPALKIGSKLSIGETVGIVGHPALMDITLTKGELIQYMKVAVPVPEEFCVRSKEVNGPFKETGNIFYPCAEFIDRAGQTNVVILGGNSGSPTVNFYGNVVGVAFAGRSGDGSNWAIIVPLEEVQEFLKPY